MLYRISADLVVAMHLAFVLFAVLGGFLVARWKRCAWVHAPAFLWAAFIELSGWVCPLTPLENWLRNRGGANGYRAGFIEHYILPVLYPAALTRQLQIALGLLVIAVNLGIYGWLWRRPLKHKM
ncbi:MAG: hypothetical protein XU15_C0010G0082 [candidate division NC10 bacterium CSP1-5]|nr:MAG: hypothetical protein XU15_C0010G0082 [candidate division NC10 bacterium CSP1-5]